MGNEQLPLDSNKLVHDGFAATDKDVGGWPIDDRIITIPHVDTPCVFVILNAERTRSSSSSRAGEGNLLVAVTISSSYHHYVLLYRPVYDMTDQLEEGFVLDIFPL